MPPEELLESTDVPDSGGELRLFKHGPKYSLRLGGGELMNSEYHSSEDDLANLACEMIKDVKKARILVGGLGMGYTLRAALNSVGPEAKVFVSELVPEVVQWNRTYLGHLAGHPLDDKRTEVLIEDVAESIFSRHRAFDAILLDVDNGPEALLREDNERIYDEDGLCAIGQALRPGGVLAQWSGKSDKSYVARLMKTGFDVREVSVRAKEGKGAHHKIWLSTLDAPVPSPRDSNIGEKYHFAAVSGPVSA